VEHVSAAVHLAEIGTDELDPLCKLLFDVAAAGDPVAAKVVAWQADEIVAMVRVAADRLGLLDRST
jgi:hypothetical protein